MLKSLTPSITDTPETVEGSDTLVLLTLPLPELITDCHCFEVELSTPIAVPYDFSLSLIPLYLESPINKKLDTDDELFDELELVVVDFASSPTSTTSPEAIAYTLSPFLMPATDSVISTPV